MAFYDKDNISLEQAMNMELTQLFRVWRTPGIHFSYDLPEGARHIRTLITKSYDRTMSVHISVHIHFAIPGGSCFNVATVSSFTSLKELKDTFPKLFELTGYLYAMG